MKVWSRSFDPHAPRWARTLKEHQRPSFKRHVGPDRVSVDRCACRSFTSASSVVAAQLQVRDDRGDARLRRGDERGVRRCRGSSLALTLEPRVPPQRLRRGAQASAHEIWLIGRKLAFGPYLRARGGTAFIVTYFSAKSSSSIFMIRESVCVIVASAGPTHFDSRLSDRAMAITNTRRGTKACACGRRGRRLKRARGVSKGNSRSHALSASMHVPCHPETLQGAPRPEGYSNSPLPTALRSHCPHRSHRGDLPQPQGMSSLPHTPAAGGGQGHHPHPSHHGCLQRGPSHPLQPSPSSASNKE